MVLLFAFFMSLIIIGVSWLLIAMLFWWTFFVKDIVNSYYINKNQYFVNNELIWNYAWMDESKLLISKIWGINWILFSKNGYIGKYNFKNWWYLYFTWNSKFKIKFNDSFRTFLFDSVNNNWSYIPKWNYDIRILSYSWENLNFWLYISWDNFYDYYPFIYKSGTFLVVEEQRYFIKDKLINKFNFYPLEIYTWINLFDTNREKWNLIHFYASWKNFKSVLYFSWLLNLSIPVDVTVWSTVITWCTNQIRGFYLKRLFNKNSLDNFQYFPLYDGDNVWSYFSNVVTSWWFFTNCSNVPSNSIYWSIDFYYSWDYKFSIYAGRKYDYTTNSMINETGNTLQIVNKLGNDYILWFFYETDNGIWFLNWVFTGSIIFENLLNYVNNNDINSSISSFTYTGIYFNIWWEVIRKLFY